MPDRDTPGGVPARGVLHTLLVDSVAARTVSALSQVDVEAILLKGPGLGRLLYGRSGVRLYTDVDLLVRTADWARAQRVLSEAGYWPRAPRSDANKHAETWVHASMPAIDLHRTVWGATAPAQTVWHVVYGGSRVLSVAGTAVRIPDNSFIAFHAAVHALQSGPSARRRWGELKMLLEGEALADWDQIEQCAREVRGTAALHAALSRFPGLVTFSSNISSPLGLRLLARPGTSRFVELSLKWRYRRLLTGRFLLRSSPSDPPVE